MRGDYAAALGLFEEVTRRFPESSYAVRARLQQAYCHAALGRDSEAAGIAAEILAQSPSGIDLDKLMRFQFDLGLKTADPAQSVGILELTAALAPDAALRSQARVELAGRQFALGRYEDAWSSCELALRETLDPATRAEALLMSALSDLASDEDWVSGAYRLDRGQERLREVLGKSTDPSLLAKAQEGVRLSEGLSNAEDTEQRHIYRMALRTLGPGDPPAPKLFKRAAKRYHATPVGEVARFYQAESRRRSGSLWSAFKTYQKYIEEYPVSARESLAIEREFAIGRELEQEGSLRRATDVMEAVAQNNPVGAYADDAYMSLGRIGLQRERFDEARDMFDAVTQNYTRSEWASAATYYGGVADLRQSDGASNREMLLARARRSFELYLHIAPDGPFAEEARSGLDDCAVKQAQDMMEIAGFYSRRGQPNSAKVYYRELARLYPRTEAAKAANEILAGEPEGSQP